MMKFIKFSSAAWILFFSKIICAENFPDRPVTLVVPFAPGGGNTAIVRLIEKGLSENWKQKIIVVFKPGAGSVIGTDLVAKALPDGHTIGMVTTAHLINPSMGKSMPFDTVKDLSGISLIAFSPILISATNALPASNLSELIALSKNQPGTLSYTTPGLGTAMHLGVELLKSETGADIMHIPYNRSSDAFNDVIAGRVHLHIGTIFASLPQIQANNIKPIALMSIRRSAVLPETPVVAETLRGFQVESMFGIVAPSGTPRRVVNKISADIAKILNSPAAVQRMSEIGLVPVGNTPDEFDAYIRAEIPKWAKVVKSSGARAD